MARAEAGTVSERFSALRTLWELDQLGLEIVPAVFPPLLASEGHCRRTHETLEKTRKPARRLPHPSRRHPTPKHHYSKNALLYNPSL